VCDLAYVLLLDQLERQVLADRHVAAVLMTAGAEGVELPTLYERRAAFDVALVADPVAPAVVSEVDSEQMELRRALGVA
jgi:hypothetical protein